jgi:hypothetical protein
MTSKGFRTFIVTLTAAVLTLSACRPAVGQDEPAAGQGESKQEKQEKKEEKKEAMAQGTPVFWQEPADISARNLLLGPGGEEMKPDLKQVIWEESSAEGGYSVKWKVRDASGKHWVVKLGNEAQPETVATRLVWAAGASRRAPTTTSGSTCGAGARTRSRGRRSLPASSC